MFENVDSVALIANGAIHDYAFIAGLLRGYDKRIAVDGGLIHCHTMHVQPDLLVGDFDSVSAELLHLYRDTPMQKFPRDKDETDMEIAVQAADTMGVKKIGIFGAMEWRTDHAVANLHLMRRHAHKVIIETERESLFVISGKSRLACHPGQTVSLIPLGAPAKGVTTKGLKWELNHSTLDTNFMSISNICLENSFDITIDEGDLICCLLRL